MDESQVHELDRFVVGGRVLVEEQERIQFAEIDLQLLPAAAQWPLIERYVELIPGLREDGRSVIGLAVQPESGGIGCRKLGIQISQAIALAHAEMEKQAALAGAQRAARQADLRVAAPGQLALGLARGGRAGIGALRDGRERHSGGNALERLDRPGLFLHAERLELHRLEPRGDFRIVLRQAIAFHRAAELGIRGLQRFDARFDVRCGGCGGIGQLTLQLRIARLQAREPRLHLLQHLGDFRRYFRGLGGQAEMQCQGQCQSQRSGAAHLSIPRACRCPRRRRSIPRRRP